METLACNGPPSPVCVVRVESCIVLRSIALCCVVLSCGSLCVGVELVSGSGTYKDVVYSMYNSNKTFRERSTITNMLI